MRKIKNVLVYKRTHPGDPDEFGCFGAQDCMGTVRSRDYDAVIGIGGISAEPVSYGIARKLNWVGIGPKKESMFWGRGPVVWFDQFLLLEERGPLLSRVAPLLANHMYNTNRRHVMSAKLSIRIQKEIEKILDLARRNSLGIVSGKTLLSKQCKQGALGCNIRKGCRR